MQIFNDIFRPKGIGEIQLTTEATHVRFRWDGQHGVVYLNQISFEKLSPELRYFVLMHELGHLKTMPLFATKASQDDEINADNYALEACRKVGIIFPSVEAVSSLYTNQINQ